MNKVKLLFSLLALVITLGADWSPLLAQSGVQWSIPRRIPGYADDAPPPVLVADRNKTVHAFVAQADGPSLGIFYNQFTADGGWTRPNDIILVPGAQNESILGAFLDASGMMHLTFYAGNDQGGTIYYSQAPGVNAAQASAWSTPVALDSQAASPAAGVMVGDDKGRLSVLYFGYRDGRGLYHIESTDGGNTWSEPNAVHLADTDTPYVSSISAIADDKGQLHTVWTADKKTGTGETVYYARLDSAHREWTLPQSLQSLKPGDFEANWASIINYKGELFVLYNYSMPPRRWMRRSIDGGKTWTEPVIAFTSKGSYGQPVLVLDSNDNLHALLGNRTEDERLHGMWHTEWQGDHWNDLEAVISGPVGTSFDPTAPQAIVSQGNVLLVTWITDPGLASNGVWFSYARLPSPELAMAKLPIPASSPTPLPTSDTLAASTPGPTRTPVAAVSLTTAGGTAAPPVLGSNPLIGILAAMLPIILLLLAVYVIQRIRQVLA